MAHQYFTKLIGAVLLLIALFTGAARAQTPGQQTLFAHQDYPADYQIVSLSAGQFYFAGWAFNCYTRQQPADIPTAAAYALYYRDTDASGVDHIVMLTSAPGGGLQVWPRLARPDVANAFASRCGVPPQIGLAIYPTVPLPLGTRYYTLYVMDPSFGVLAAPQTFLLNVQP